MNPDDFYKKFLEGAEISAVDENGVKQVLEAIRLDSSVMNRAEAPAGYEEELLNNLNRRLPAVNVTVPHRRKEDRRWWIFNPGFSWSLSGVLAVAVVVLVAGLRYEFYKSEQLVETDILTQTAKKGPNRMVANWVASVGDSATQIRVAHADINTIAEDMARSQNSAGIAHALEAVAHRMGL